MSVRKSTFSFINSIRCPASGTSKAEVDEYKDIYEVYGVVSSPDAFFEINELMRDFEDKYKANIIVVKLTFQKDICMLLHLLLWQANLLYFIYFVL